MQKKILLKNVQVSSFLLRWAEKRAGPVSLVGLDTGRVRVLPPNPDVLEIVILPDQTSCVCEQKIMRKIKGEAGVLLCNVLIQISFMAFQKNN